MIRSAYQWLSIACLAFMASCQTVTGPKPSADDQPTKDTSHIVVLGLPATYGALTQFALDGSVHLYDEEQHIEYHSDSAGFYKRNVPASTFKIITSLLAIEKGLLRDQYQVKAWNNRQQKNTSWNKDQDLQEAFALSTNWFFEDLTTALGSDTINAWLRRIGYPAAVNPSETKFWLDTRFTISPKEQIELMQKLYHQELPFSARTMDITKSIMLRKDTLGIQIYGKTGWGTPNGKNIGWYIGWAQFAQRKPIYFATCIEQNEPASQSFSQWRMEVTEMALKEAFPQAWNTSQLSKQIPE
jgi:beta-lactamase class D